VIASGILVLLALFADGCAHLAAAANGASDPPPAAVQGLAAPAASPTATPPGARCVAVDGKADRACTPGARNPQVTQSNLSTTVCRSGWTATVRPPTSYTNGLKDSPTSPAGKAAYGEQALTDQAVEEDHLLPLELGGDPRDPANIWPEPWDGPAGAHTKDAEENSLHRAVCGGRMTLRAAQDKILADWTH
jgi:hypothetical protein